MRTIVFLNKKEGWARPALAIIWPERSSRPRPARALVDTDPQANLTQGMLGPAVARAFPPIGRSPHCSMIEAALPCQSCSYPRRKCPA